MYFSKDADSVPTFESPWIHRGWTPALGSMQYAGLCSSLRTDCKIWKAACWLNTQSNVPAAMTLG